MSIQQVLVITTDSPSEGKIKKHLKPVTTHVVAGTNIVSDFFAGMSDVFGGRSGNYKKQLSSIYNEAIENIKQEAYRIGANGVVGLKIDIDEISGKGKSMFMITAIGTAVIIEYGPENSSILLEKRRLDGRVSNDSIKNLRYLKNLLSQAEKGELKDTSETWEFIIQIKVKEIYPFILQNLQKILSNPTEHFQPTKEKFSHNTSHYLQQLDIDDQVDLIYNSLLNQETGGHVSKFLLNYINNQELFHFESTMKMLRSNNLKVQKRGLRISTFDSPYYSFEEEAKLQKISKEIEEVFRDRSSTAIKKGFLSSKGKEAWECECGKVNNDETTYCTKCENNKYGFKEQELKPAGAMEAIRDKTELIKDALHAMK